MNYSLQLDHLYGLSLLDSLKGHPEVDHLKFASPINGANEWDTYLVHSFCSTQIVGGIDQPEILNKLKIILRAPTEARNEVELNSSGPPFMFGWVGHLTYEVASWIEPSLSLPQGALEIPALCFRKYAASLSWHEPSQRMWLFATSAEEANSYLRAVENLITEDKQQAEGPLHTVKISSDVLATKFQDQVKSIQNRILAGDFYQANLTRMLSVELGNTSRSQLTGFAERFLNQSQAPFGAILNFENATVISASPERFFRIEPTAEGRKIFAEPIKGTRPRHADPELDEALKQDLLNSEKDRAENIMIADLVRNDLSRICTDESIIADPVCELRSFANVHHLVTRVSGVLREDVSNFDALLAQFPCGSITGAPKWAAMDAIAELEQRGRGIYCGAIGYFDDRGHADFSVAIRTAVASFSESGTMLTYGTGGGITILSDPQEEFRETEDKAAGFLRALQP